MAKTRIAAVQEAMMNFQERTSMFLKEDAERRPVMEYGEGELPVGLHGRLDQGSEIATESSEDSVKNKRVEKVLVTAPDRVQYKKEDMELVLRMSGADDFVDELMKRLQAVGTLKEKALAKECQRISLTKRGGR